MDKWMQLIYKAQEGDKKSRDTLIEENLGLVHHIVKRYTNRGYDNDELFQIGCIGLIKAVDHFDVSYKVQFSTYAVPMIMGEIRRFIRDNTMLKMPRSVKENALKINGAREKLVKQLGREPTIDEIIYETKLTKEEVILATDLPWDVESLSKPMGLKDGKEICLQDKMADSVDTQEDIVRHVFLDELMKKLTSFEAELIRLRYYENKTQLQTATLLDMTQVQVSRMEKKILTKLRSMA